jgi:cytidine deaminase
MKKVNFKNLSHEEQILVKMAEEVRKNAFCPYSRYKAGTAVLAENGKIYVGCNVETSVFKTPHAEENAISAMIADGGRRIIAVCCMAKHFPCGPCRQFIWDFSGGNSSLKIIKVDLKGNIVIATIGELLPEPFGPKDLGIDPEKY